MTLMSPGDGKSTPFSGRHGTSLTTIPDLEGLFIGTFRKRCPSEFDLKSSGWGGPTDFV